jgi:hypothetical protein
VNVIRRISAEIGRKKAKKTRKKQVNYGVEKSIDEIGATVVEMAKLNSPLGSKIPSR